VTAVGAAPARVDIFTYRGEPVDFTVPALDRDRAAVSAESLTGWTAVAKAKSDPDSSVLATFTTTITSAGVRVSATGTQTRTWAWATARWDLVLVDPAGDYHPLCAGIVQTAPTISGVTA
jgi:hypothetical protein